MTLIADWKGLSLVVRVTDTLQFFDLAMAFSKEVFGIESQCVDSNVSKYEPEEFRSNIESAEGKPGEEEKNVAGACIHVQELS